MRHKTSFEIINMYSISVKTGLQSYCDTSYSLGGVNQMWILKKSNLGPSPPAIALKHLISLPSTQSFLTPS